MTATSPQLWEGQLPLGARTVHGSISAAAIIEGERYYFMVQKATKTRCMSVAMMPAFCVEEHILP